MLVRAGIASMLGDFQDLLVVAELDAADLPRWLGHADVVVVDAALAGGLAAAVARLRARGATALALGDGDRVQAAALAGAAALVVPDACRFTLATAVREAHRHPSRAFQVWCDGRSVAVAAADARLSRC